MREFLKDFNVLEIDKIIKRIFTIPMRRLEKIVEVGEFILLSRWLTFPFLYLFLNISISLQFDSNMKDASEIELQTKLEDFKK